VSYKYKYNILLFVRGKIANKMNNEYIVLCFMLKEFMEFAFTDREDSDVDDYNYN